MASTTTAAKTTPTGRVSATDPKTGRKYVATQIIAGAKVTVTKFTWKPDESGWASATYDVTSPSDELFAGAVKWDGKSWKVGSKTAPTLTKAVQAVLGIAELPVPKPRKSTATTGTTPKQPRASKGKGISQNEAAELANRAADAGAEQATQPSKRKSAAARKADKLAADQAAAAAAAAGPVESVLDTDPATGLPRVKPEVAAKADEISAAAKAKREETEAAVARIESGETTVEGEVIDILKNVK